ncbi:MAG: tyrosine-type recombinase/integrase, partial [Armatimonadetes bacterium]|nr:tyrosine-type recombinase/integrase [Armatimonadota bacterium]
MEEEQAREEQAGRGVPAAPVPRAAVDLPLAAFAAPRDAGALADALVAGQLSPRTRRAYAADLAELLSVLDAWGLDFRHVTRDHLHAWRAWLDGQDAPGLPPRKRCAPATVSRKVCVCRRLFAEALERGLIQSDPAARLRGFSVSPESKTPGLSREDARRLLAAIDTSTLLGLRDLAILSLMLRTGLRRMDVINATVGALGEQRGHKTLRVVSKGNRERLVKVPPEVAWQVERWREAARAL